MMKDLIIFGASGFGREVAWAVERINKVSPTWKLLGFMDDADDNQGKAINGYPVLGKTGDVGKYSDALKIIEKFLNDLDLSHKSDQMLDLVTAIRDDLHKQNPNFTSHVRDANRLMLADSVMKNFNDTGKIFSTKEREEDLFKNLFNDPKDLEVTVKKCIDMDTHLRAVASIHDRVKDIEAIVESIGGELNNVQINKFQLDDLAKMVKMFANIFTAYATVINDLYRVNHNLTWCIKEIRNISLILVSGHLHGTAAYLVEPSYHTA